MSNKTYLLKRRLVSEKLELDKKIKKLSIYKNSKEILHLDKYSQDLLNIQLGTMKLYSTVLSQRLTRI